MLISAILKLLVSLVFLSSSSIVLYVTFRSMYLPQNAIFKEPIYFDFTKSEPTAKITLFAEEKQWEYVDRRAKSTSASSMHYKRNRRFLLPYTTYIISLELALAKSQRNRGISKFMLEMKTVSINNTELAFSSRPVVIPYQSTVSKVLECLIFFPFRLFGIFRSSETVNVKVNMMNNYVEPIEQTERLEFRVSTNDADIEEVTLSLFPRLNMIMYCMYYFPWLSFVAGVCVIGFFEMCFCLFGLLLYYGYKWITAELELDRRDRASSSDAGLSEEDEKSSEDSDDLFVDGLERVVNGQLSASGGGGPAGARSESIEDEGDISGRIAIVDDEEDDSLDPALAAAIAADVIDDDDDMGFSSGGIRKRK